jgi:hypothetical protein
MGDGVVVHELDLVAGFERCRRPSELLLIFATKYRKKAQLPLSLEPLRLGPWPGLAAAGATGDRRE